MNVTSPGGSARDPADLPAGFGLRRLFGDPAMSNVGRHIWEWFSSAVGDGLNELFHGIPAFAANPWESVRDELVAPFRERWEDFVSNTVPSAYTEMMDRVKDLAESIQTAGGEVFEDIARAVQSALDTGVIAPQTDGGLAETYDAFTPEGKVPEIDFGPLPGISTAGGGVHRDRPGASAGSAPPPPPPPSGQAADAGPTHEDLGLEPGTFFEYQPGEGVVVITHADGTQEVRPWP